MKQNTLIVPHHVIINLTSKCNLRCRHCFGDYGLSKGRELSLNEWKRVIDDLAKNNIFYINLTGGEPTQYPDFRKLLEYINKKGLLITLTTNGIFPEETLNEIISNKEIILNVKISLDGYDPESNWFIRRSPNLSKEELFSKIINTIEELKKEGIQVSISTVLHKKNLMCLEKLADLLIKLNINKWLLSPITYIGRAKINEEILDYKGLLYVLNNKIVSLEEKMKKHNIDLELVDFPITKEYSNFHFICGATTTFCEIDSDGLVSPCALSRIVLHKRIFPFENILDQSIYNIWNGNAFSIFRKLQTLGCK